jgi:cyclophilin family peptidyl-prolyl cis-trans isomerase/HEAT repeat protein
MRTWAVLTIALVAAQGQREISKAPQDVRRLVILAAEDARAPTRDDLRLLFETARSDNPTLQTTAVRALGRLERRALTTNLLPYARAESSSVREEAANALAQVFRGEPLTDVPPRQQVQASLDALLGAPPSDGAYRALGRLPFDTEEQARAAENALRRAIESKQPSVGAARGLESFARLHRKQAPPLQETIQRLREVVAGTDKTYGDVLRRNALAALVAAQGVDVETLTVAMRSDDPELRRLAVLSLVGAGSPIDRDKRLDIVRVALDDRSPMVRLEAIREWARRATDAGCLPLLQALKDPSMHVVTAALDALGDQCRDDDSITVTVASEARTPPPQGSWHREAHAFVALSKRSQERTAVGMMSFATHQVWQVRMYAARAAAQLDDLDILRRLALDDTDNVRQATLAPLRKRLGAESDEFFIAALARPDYQLLRTAARELKGSDRSEPLASALVGALLRVSAEKKETSRDIRLAIVERLAEVGSVANATPLEPLLRDFDPQVARAVGALLQQWTGTEQKIDPQPLPRFPLPTESELAENVRAVVEMASGRTFRMIFLTDQAPLARTRFIRLARRGYYDNLTFHRVVPNAFIQGGSPGANEYVGDALYMRDEVGLEMHTRGAVGISTRGRDTGDAQIFINLVDNPYLDHTYTVFARVCADDMNVVDDILEGDRMTRVRLVPGGTCR